MVNHRRSLIGVFQSARDAELALRDLRDSGFLMNQVSVIAKDAQTVTSPIEPAVDRAVGNKAQQGTTVGAIAGGAVGSTIGLIVGMSAVAMVPGLGPIMLLGAAATALATTLGSGVLGATAGGLLGALIGYGIPEDRAKLYHDRIHRGEYLVIAEGVEAELRRAEAILSRWPVQDLQIYLAPKQSSRLS